MTFHRKNPLTIYFRINVHLRACDEGIFRKDIAPELFLVGSDDIEADSAFEAYNIPRLRLPESLDSDSLLDSRGHQLVAEALSKLRGTAEGLETRNGQISEDDSGSR